jgi:Zn-dependent M28 family amino/carboxypeptidase
MKEMLKSYKSTKIILLFIIVVLVQACRTAEPVPVVVPTDTAAPLEFDGERAYQQVATQLEFGPRTPRSDGHTKIVDWMEMELQTVDWDVNIQKIPVGDYTIQNVIAKRGSGEPWIILGAHYDTRFVADEDPDPEKRTEPVPGANDGASGVAVLLELARILPEDLPGEVWLVFFDAEDNGRIPGWNWIMGSTAFVAVLEGQPDAVVIADMIGDTDLDIYWEPSSNQELTREIWDVAESLGYADNFIASPGPRIIDDHTPFLRAGIPAVDIIDFNYPYWHTVADTLDKVSPDSLKAVGDVLYTWLLTKLSIESAS